MPIPFILGAIAGATCVSVYLKKDKIKENLSSLKDENFAKSAGKCVENTINKIQNFKLPCICEKAAQQNNAKSKKAAK
ncbi:hypothetical protein [Campylobacter canadensis]|uniref:Lipoprotein n=1 Tax=Campylobacter canadensis TaxID=449520 RepID=A0ABS7WSC1_9BACT|nr:hypothetical protein [Campylobacter canadensis]MBZ7987659.1 hypothetical protein [Campylobacter canadensis]MBZ7995018.1 hypothetical protein [Campylobacter canadensis]MBZ7996960.1 hypothetical protein [Campylobacter canadensis]MBZ7998804.1 hypothetical protein [Campylobacter canadensis]MBZ8000439.1 hypothetical protein [Campylobacter canadensis]